MRDRRAHAVLFGFDFQVNAAIVLMLENIRELKSLRLEGNEEDIELTLEDNRKILAQAKSENMFFVTHDKKFLIIMSPASYLFKNSRQYLLYYPSLHLVHTMDHLHDRISIILRCRPALAARVLFLAQPFHIGGRPLHDIFIAVVHALLSQRIRRSICL